jgi:hypothetical protein
MDLENSFLNAITESFKAYNEHGARSNKKLMPIHKWFAEVIENKLGDKYYTKCLGNGGEYKLNGKYYPKNLDISIFNKETNKLISTISFKFVTSNYKQNANNYFENLLGETANIRRVNVGFAHFLVLRRHTPYYTKNKGNLRGELKKIELISERDLMKYIKLYNDLNFPHKPDVLGIALIDFDNNENAYFVDLDSMKISEEDIGKINKILEKAGFSNEKINEINKKLKEVGFSEADIKEIEKELKKAKIPKKDIKEINKFLNNIGFSEKGIKALNEMSLNKFIKRVVGLCQLMD